MLGNVNVLDAYEKLSIDPSVKIAVNIGRFGKVCVSLPDSERDATRKKRFAVPFASLDQWRPLEFRALVLNTCRHIRENDLAVSLVREKLRNVVGKSGRISNATRGFDRDVSIYETHSRVRDNLAAW